MNILIVDDRPENLHLLRALLEGHGYTVDEARHGAEALVKARQAPPLLVISDLLMPVMDGYTLLRQWKADERLKQIPFVVYTASYTEPKDERLALDLGADAFILQPCKHEPFIASIQEILAEDQRHELPPARVPHGDEQVLLKEYNEVLIHKLEEKTSQLEEANRALQAKIAEHKQSEETLQKSEGRYRSILESMEEGYYEVDIAGNLTFFNESTTRIFGYPREKLLGMNNREYTSPETAKKMYRIFNQVYRTGESASDSDYEIIRPDGSRRSLEISTALWRDDTGCPAGFRGVVRDITERKEAEAERDRLISAIEQAVEIIVITDTKGTIQYVNPAFETVTGYTREEAIGQNPRILKSGLHDRDFYRAMWETVSGGKTWEGSFVNKKKDGTLYTEEATISPVHDAAGTIVSYVAVKRDITERLRLHEEKTQLEGQYLQSQKMEAVGRLAGGVAHDFNNMLQVILGHSSLALLEVGPETPLYSSLQEIESAALRSADLTSQLLAFARKQTVSPKVLDLNDTVSGMLKMLGRLIGEDIDLAWKPGHDLWHIKIDPSQIDQILANLTVNGRDAIEGVGKVTIETSNAVFDEAYCADHAGFVPGEYVLLAVSDDGCGMDAETADHIFEPFFTTKGVGEGTGLGLSTVYGVVKQNNGFINVYSEPGHGTTFKIYLPRFMQDTTEVPAKRVAKALRGGMETVLIVEDVEEVLLIGKRMLEGLGYTVLTASRPSHAIRLLLEYAGDIHLLITDVVMPEMNGLDLSERLTLLKPGLKCLFMSGYTANVIAHRGVLEEGLLFIAKPFSEEALAAKVREALDR